MNCIFCKIIKGEIPSTKIYEDENSLAFLDISPVNIGHTLIIPKEHFQNIYEIPEELIMHLTKIAKKISIALKKSLNADGINVNMNNDPAALQIVMHAHIHIIPRFKNDGFGPWQGKRPYNEGEMEEIKNKIISKL